MKKTMITLLVLIAVAGLALTACGGDGASLDGTSWVLTDLDGSAPVAGRTVTVEFTDGQVGGDAGCNSYGGSYHASGDQLTTSDVFSTLMACPEQGVMDQESTYLKLLGDAASYQVNGSQLVITTSGGDTLTFTDTGN